MHQISFVQAELSFSSILHRQINFAPALVRCLREKEDGMIEGNT